MALTKIKAAGLTADLIDETKLADNSIDSEHYNDGSIDNAHLADDAVDSDELATGAVDIDHLSATGTASSSTFLRGDNSWVTPTDTNTQLSTEEVQDIVGAMFTSNTETNITATYEDSDGTIDLVSTDTVIGGATGVDFNDNVKIRLGTGNDLEIYHDETDDVIHSTGTSLRTRSNIFRANNAANSAVLFRATAGGNFEAYYDGSKKLETSSSGVEIVNGDLRCALDLKVLNDGRGIYFGAGNDLVIKHDGSHSFVQNSTGELKLTSDTIRLQSTTGNELFQWMTKDGAVQLYYDDSKKLETNSLGIHVTGRAHIGHTTADPAPTSGSHTGNFLSLIHI